DSPTGAAAARTTRDRTNRDPAMLEPSPRGGASTDRAHDSVGGRASTLRPGRLSLGRTLARPTDRPVARPRSRRANRGGGLRPFFGSTAVGRRKASLAV